MSQNNLKTEMISLFNETAEYAKNFHKKTYEADIERLKLKHENLLDKVQQAFESSDEAFNETAAYIAEYVEEQLTDYPTKRKRDMACLEYNMNMVSYFVPLMGEIISIKAKPFTEKMVECWNTKMPENKIGHSTRANIQNGFKKGVLCYITTAVCKSLEKADDCYELSLLRQYRDSYLLHADGGAEVVQEYYNIAPTIVKRIDKKENATEIYKEIWKDYLNPCVRLIEENQKEACQSLYSEMVHKLEKKYLYS